MKNFSGCCRLEVDVEQIENAKVFLSQREEKIEHSSTLFALLGNAVRLRIVTLFLRYERLCVCDLADILEMRQSPISQHLRKLKDGGVLQSIREGVTVYYFIAPKLKEKMEITLKDLL